MARPSFDSSDLTANRTTGSLGYLLFFLPLIACPASKYGRFCANQGLLLLIAFILVRVAFSLLTALLGWVPVLGWLISAVGAIATAVVVLVALYLFLLAVGKDDPHEVPFIGQTQILR